MIIVDASGRLEQLDEVARRVDGEDLGAAGTGDDLVAERHAFLGEAGDLGLEVVEDEVDPVPPAGPGRSPSAIARPAELCGPRQQERRLPRVTSANAGDSRCRR